MVGHRQPPVKLSVHKISEFPVGRFAGKIVSTQKNPDGSAFPKIVSTQNPLPLTGHLPRRLPPGSRRAAPAGTCRSYGRSRATRRARPNRQHGGAWRSSRSPNVGQKYRFSCLRVLNCSRVRRSSLFPCKQNYKTKVVGTPERLYAGGAFVSLSWRRGLIARGVLGRISLAVSISSAKGAIARGAAWHAFV